MAKPLERSRARQLRQEGMSVKDIAEQLGVTKSSVSIWVRDVELSGDQKAALREKYHHYPAKIRGSLANSQKALRQRTAYQAEGRAKARR
ncbi:MAG: helix-turn-helix domain-containing protein [Anaerolineae bacterium]